MVYKKIISQSKHTHGADLSIKSKAYELRKKMTKAEKKLWEYLRLKRLEGKHFRRQHPYGIYILDFFCAKSNLAIEVDGEIHKFNKEYVDERTKYLEESGLKVLRFTNAEVEEKLNEVIFKIRSHL
jgi:5-methyltetrahydrofolate--homocysteine methyltransferase/ATP-dependent helicase HrpA